MTDEMTVQGQRPSTTPYLLGGAVVGGLAGGATAKYANFGINGKYAKSWEEAIAEANKNDTYVSSKINNTEGEVKTAWETLQQHAKAVKEAREALKLPEGVDIKDFDELFEKIKLKDAADEAVKTKEASLIEDAVVNLKASIDDAFRDGGDQTFKINNVEYNTKESALDALGKYKTNSDTRNWIKTCKKQYSEAGLEELKNKAREADEAVNKAGEALKKNEKITDEVLNSVREHSKGYNETMKKAEGALGENVLNLMKKPSVMKTAIAGAAVLAVLGALVAPKHKNEA